MSVALWRLWKTPGPVVPRTLSTIAMEHDNKLYRLLASLLHHGHHGHHGATHSNPLQPTVLAQHGDGPDEIGICSWCVKQGFGHSHAAMGTQSSRAPAGPGILKRPGQSLENKTIVFPPECWVMIQVAQQYCNTIAHSIPRGSSWCILPVLYRKPDIIK